MSVPGVTTRVTSRRTMPFACRGSSIWSHTATRIPAATSLPRYALKLMMREAGHWRGVLAFVAAGQSAGRASVRRSSRRQKTARKNLPCETTTAHRGTPPWPPDTASSLGSLTYGRNASRQARGRQVARCSARSPDPAEAATEGLLDEPVQSRRPSVGACGSVGRPAATCWRRAAASRHSGRRPPPHRDHPEVADVRMGRASFEQSAERLEESIGIVAAEEVVRIEIQSPGFGDERLIDNRAGGVGLGRLRRRCRLRPRRCRAGRARRGE